MRRHVFGYVFVVILALAVAACGGDDDGRESPTTAGGGGPSPTTAPGGLAGESILQADIPGTSNSRITSDTRDEVVRQLDVDGDWETVAIELVKAARANGFQITRVNCSGSGHDIVGFKSVAAGVHLIEGRSAERGATIVISVRDAASPSFRSTGQCPGELVNAAL